MHTPFYGVGWGGALLLALFSDLIFYYLYLSGDECGSGCGIGMAAVMYIICGGGIIVGTIATLSLTLFRWKKRSHA
ncbi:hypothetical protein BOW53_12015 [Solemya pervernicosa gill symbiont]|uniref:Uncharacterized protein n=2 Tax=Gammaproteobacteria incertae sedis TaxID=118884 RepID=A0A1T2L2G7_9GAMM|nr:hypothetical protein [Candidatus Reidiella endopervernicosa]OOZ39285.1 hypothetical protein BOW53_12015 [Solemya pervernicosa gill symbiont]QKQ25536.1 hypothetical protein HUE57_03905 [Candidatus Reidiella endopervernicosa]